MYQVHLEILINTKSYLIRELRNDNKSLMITLTNKVMYGKIYILDVTTGVNIPPCIFQMCKVCTTMYLLFWLWVGFFTSKYSCFMSC